MFGLRRPELDWVDDLDLDPPVDTGSEEEVLAWMTETPIPPIRDPEWLEDTIPRAPAPPRPVPPRRRTGAVLLVALAVLSAAGLVASGCAVVAWVAAG